jgi:hypothetical protein
MGQYVATAPESLVVRVRNDNCGVLSKAAFDLILVG